MATLTGPEIVRQMAAGNIEIEPFFPEQVNPNSYNLTLGDRLLVYAVPPWWERAAMRLRGDPWCLDMAKDNPTREVTIPPEGLRLKPGVLYLGATAEYTATHHFVPVIEGRSSVGRLGVCVHVTAGFGDHGFAAHWTLEVTVVHPVRVYPWVEICQIVYSTLEGEESPYEGRYAGQGAVPVASRLHLSFKQPRGLARAHAGGGDRVD